MPGIYRQLYSQSFSSTDTIVVNHNLDRTGLCARIIVDGYEDPYELISSVDVSSSDPRNSLTVNLLSAQTGLVQICSTDTVPVETPSPENAAILQGLAFSSLSAYTTTASVINSTTYVDLLLDVQRYTPGSAFSHTPGSAEVTINDDGRYFISYFVTVTATSGTSRSESQVRMQRQQGVGFNTIPGTTSFVYNRTSAQGAGTAAVSFTMDLSSGDILKVQANRESGGSTLGYLSNGCGLTIWRIQ